MSFELPAFGPVIGAVVVTDIAQQQAGFSPMNDQPDIAAHPNRPKPVIFRAIELMELQSRMSRVQLEIEGRGLDRLLLVAGELGQAVRKCVGDPEFHARVSMVPCTGLVTLGALHRG